MVLVGTLTLWMRFIGAVGWPLVFSNGLTFIFSFVWGAVSDSMGRRWAMIIPAVIGLFVTPFYLLTTEFWIIAVAFSVQGAFAGAIYGQNPSYLSERFPTEVRATAAAFCYHVSAIVAGFVAPILTYFAVDLGYGFAMPMLIGTSGGIISFILALLCGPETKGKVLVADLEIITAAEVP